MRKMFDVFSMKLSIRLFFILWRPNVKKNIGEWEVWEKMNGLLSGTAAMEQ